MISILLNIITIINSVNGYWQQNNPAEVRAFWDNAVYHTGNIEAYKLTGNEDFLNYSLRWADFNNWQGATEKDCTKWKYRQYGEGQDYVLFGDWQICFQTYIDLATLHHKTPPLNPPLSREGVITRQLVTTPCPERKGQGERSGGISLSRVFEVMDYEVNSKQHDYWWWADALYMVMPVLTKLYKLTGNEKYLDKLYENILYTDSLMYDEETGLYFRDGKYVFPKHKTSNGKKDFWARGDGWVLAGLAKVLQDMPSSYKHYNFFKEKFIRLAESTRHSQQPEGYWTRSMMDATHAPGPETSGTALFTYGILWGVNNGILAKKQYKQTIKRAWNYLTKVALQKDGRVGYVQPIGERAIPGQMVNADSQSNFGVGAFLLAACEYSRYK